MTQQVVDILEHYGTKGMKWGVRKPRSKTTRTKFEKAPKNLTNTELEKRIKRMETEKKYNSLNKRDISKGEEMVTQILTNVGKTVATTALTGGALYGIRAGVRAVGKRKIGANITDKQMEQIEELAKMLTSKLKK